MEIIHGITRPIYNGKIAGEATFAESVIVENGIIYEAHYFGKNEVDKGVERGRFIGVQLDGYEITDTGKVFQPLENQDYKLAAK